MSMISELVNKLRFYEAGCKGAEFKKVLGEAANVIEEQGAKLQRLNMERSTQFYNNGWIPCDERLPKAEDLHNISHEECKSYLVQRRCGVMQVAHYIKVYGEPCFEFCTLKINGVIAWQPLPEPYNADAPDTNVGSKTNADKIRSMSDEELAEFITSGEWSCICPMCLYFETEECYFEGEKVKTNCVQGIMDWLKAESEG